MASENTNYDEELRVAVEAAKQAGKIIDEYRRTEIEVEGRKESYNDIVTEADEEVQKTVRQKIADEFPEDGFLGEENNLSDEKNRTWVVDPIDGTNNFYKGFEYFCTSIALKVDNEYKVGVVLSPETGLNQMFFAIRGDGAYVYEDMSLGTAEELDVSAHSSFKGSMLISKLKDELGQDEKEMELSFLSEAVDEGVMFRKVDAGALGITKVAQGVADGFFSAVENEWDLAAAKLIVEEAGGDVRLKDSVFEDRYEVVASNGLVQKDLEELVDQHIQELRN